MSRPIDIPGNAPKRPKRSVPQNEASFGKGPHFGFIEISESGHVRRMISTGINGYVEVKPRTRLPPLVFVIQKDGISGEIILEIASSSLKRSIQEGLQSHFEKPPLKIDFDLVLSHYDALKTHTDQLELKDPNEYATLEIRLLVRDLLPERALYEGIGLAKLRQRGLACPSLVQDVYQRGIQIGLDEIEGYCALGTMPEQEHESYLERFNAQFTNTARFGDFLALQDLCEPVVGSGEIEFQYNPDLLLDLLDQGHFEAYVYILDLVDRTRPSVSGTWDPNFSDVSLEPMFVAIRLGHLPVVENFVSNNVFFEGRVYEGDQHLDVHVFTPLFSAVFWGHHDIVGLLLRSGPFYSPGYHQAAALALAQDRQDIIQLFTESTILDSPSSLLSSFPESWIAPISQQASANVGCIGAQDSFIHSELPPQTHENNSGLPYPDNIPPLTSFSSSVPAEHLEIEPSTLLMPDLAFSLPNHVLASISERPDGRFGSFVNANGSPTLAKETGHHKSRRRRCRGAVIRLEKMLQKLKRFCDDDPESFGDLLLLPLADQVWAAGVDGFRRILENQAPSGLAEIVQCLLLADALIYQLPVPSASVQYQFSRDLQRWRSILSADDQSRFDQVVRAIWGPRHGLGKSTPPPSAEDLLRFQELIQNLVGCQGRNGPTRRNSHMPGSRLRNLQCRRQTSSNRPVELSSTSTSVDSPFNSIGAVLDRLTVNDESPGDNFDLADFLHLDQFQGDEDGAATELTDVRKLLRSLKSASWKQVDSAIVLLLASVAFAVVLITASVYLGKQAEEYLTLFDGNMSDYSRSAILVESFFDIPASVPAGFSSTRGKSRREILNMKEAASGDNFEEPFIHVVESQASPTVGSVGSQGGSSVLSTSPEATRTNERPSCIQCSKKFSNISNRNKHLREGCSFRQKNGYPCRRARCTSVLSTSWYRGRHEQMRCRFR